MKTFKDWKDFKLKGCIRRFDSTEECGGKDGQNCKKCDNNWDNAEEVFNYQQAKIDKMKCCQNCKKEEYDFPEPSCGSEKPCNRKYEGAEGEDLWEMI